jgi:hypothetical protein
MAETLRRAGEVVARIVRERTPLVCALVAFAVYLPRLCPTVALLGDSATFTAAAIEWGVPQPPGYPLLTAIGHGFSKIPFGDVAWRVHLASAVAHAATVGVVAATVKRTSGSWLAAASASLTLAFSRLFFTGSLYAEAFPLNDLFTALVLFSALSIARDEGGADADGDRSTFRRLLGFAALAGLASTHHHMIALTAPAVLLLLIPTARKAFRGQPKRIALAAVAFLGPLALGYALVPLAASRNPYTSWGEVHDLGALVRLATRADYGGLFSPALRTTQDGYGVRVLFFFYATMEAYGAIALALGALGVVSLWTTSRRTATALLAGFVATGPFFAAINALALEGAGAREFSARFFTMAHVVVAIAIGYGVAYLERATASLARNRLVARAALASAWVIPLVAHYSSANLAEERIGEAFVHDLVRGVPADAVVLVAGDAYVSAATYACAVERSCERRAIFSPGQLHLDWRAEQLRRRYPQVSLGTRNIVELVERNRSERAVYVTTPLLEVAPALVDAYGFLPSSLLLRVTDEAKVKDAAEDFRRASRGMLGPSGCEGCSPSLLLHARSPLHDRVALGYAVALQNHERLARVVFDAPAEADALRNRLVAIDARSHRGW